MRRGFVRRGDPDQRRLAEGSRDELDADGQPEDLIGAERAHFGIDHVEVGLWLAQRWHLPESIVEVIARHHETPTGALDQVTVVQVACRVADLLGFGVNRPSQPPNLDEICAAPPEWTRTRIGAQMRNIQDAIAREIRLFEGSETPPLASPDVAVDEGETKEGLPACASPHDVPAEMISFPYPRAMVGAVIGAAILLLSAAALFVQR